MKLTNNRKVWVCLFGNFITMIAVLCFVCIFRDDSSTYFRYGPHDDLIVISICINTWNKWVLLILFIGLIKSCDVLVNELGSPVLGFSIYNPDKKIIDEFTKNELNFLANAMWMTNGFRNILMAVVTVTQFDIALVGMLMSEFVSIFTIRHLLNTKKFTKQSRKEENIGDGDANNEDDLLLDEVVIH